MHNNIVMYTIHDEDQVGYDKRNSQTHSKFFFHIFKTVEPHTS